MKNVRAPYRRFAVAGSLLLLAAVVWSTAEAAETVVLKPDSPASWSPSRMFAFLRPRRNYGERSGCPCILAPSLFGRAPAGQGSVRRALDVHY